MEKGQSSGRKSGLDNNDPSPSVGGFTDEGSITFAGRVVSKEKEKSELERHRSPGLRKTRAYFE